MPPAAAKPSAPFASWCAAPASPRAHSNDCGPTGDTTHSSPTPITTPPPRTSSTAPTPLSSSPSATSKKAPASKHVPSGHYGANCAWLACAVLAHNIGHWTTTLADAPPATNRSRRTRLVALAAVAVNRSGTPTLRYPARWPWETQFRATLSALEGPARTLRLSPTNRPERGAPTQTQRRQPQTTPAPLAQHAQTHQTTPPTTRRHPNPPPAQKSRAHRRPIGGFRLRTPATKPVAHSP